MKKGVVNMGKLSELIDMVKGAGYAAKGLGSEINDLKGLSIAKQSAKATMQFPIITSRSINVDTAMNVVKALERQYATFVQMVVALNPVIDWDKDTIPEFIQKIHQNNPTVLDLVESCSFAYCNEELDLEMFMSINKGCNDGKILRSNKDQLFCIEEHLNPYKVNDLYKPKSITLERANASLDYYMLSEAKNRPKKSTDVKKFKGTDAFRQAYNELYGEDPVDDNVEPSVNTNPTVGVKPDRKNTPDTTFGDAVPAGEDKPKVKSGVFSVKSEEQLRKELAEKEKMMQDIEKDNAANRARAIVKLSDNDIKKCNELVPTTLSVSLQQMKKDNFGGVINFVLGVKGLMHPVGSEEMISNLVDGFKAGNKFFNFLRWTSGEISFIKDLIFNVKGIKEDVIKKHSNGSHWWTTLKKNRSLAKVKNVLSKKNKILPMLL
jgi:hypothetical protein